MEQLTKVVKNQKGRMTYDEAFKLNGKVPPQAIEVEESVLGALLLDQNAITNAIDILDQNIFTLQNIKIYIHLFQNYLEMLNLLIY